MSRVSFMAVVLYALAGSAALAEEPQTSQQCWTPQALAGTETELKDVHDHKSLDLAPLKQVTLAPATPIAPSLRVGLVPDEGQACSSSQPPGGVKGTAPRPRAC